jgi:hypothetical protein
MKKILKYVGVTFLVLVELALIGCATVSELIMPAYVEPAAIAYSDYNSPKLLPYTSIYDARQVLKAVSFAHLLNQRELVRDIEDDKLKHDYLFEAQSLHVARAEEWSAAVFDPAGPIGILLSGGVMGSLMLFTDKPGTRKRLDKAKAEGIEEGKNGG